jgi:hypothetical protein
MSNAIRKIFCGVAIVVAVAGHLALPATFANAQGSSRIVGNHSPATERLNAPQRAPADQTLRSF